MRFGPVPAKAPPCGRGGGGATATLLAWQGRGNLYASEQRLPELVGSVETAGAGDAGQEPGGLEAILGRLRSQFDRRPCPLSRRRPLAKLRATPEKLTPDDFRLRPDSAGYRAGKDGKDLGADVDLVGPGPAYERWKKTPEYQQWLKDTKQVTKAEAPKAEPKAFVVLGGKGIEVRKFDTLAEAVQGASDGDTIEIRGNGPFVTRADRPQDNAPHDPGRRRLPTGHQVDARSG